MGTHHYDHRMSCIRAVVQDGASTHHFTLDEHASLGDLATRLSERSVLPVESMRLIANGRELELPMPLSMLGEFFFIKNAIFLLEVDHDACREWQKTGRCKKGGSCPKSSTHDVIHSPRYVAHQHAPSSASSSADSSPQPFGTGCHFAASQVEENVPTKEVVMTQHDFPPHFQLPETACIPNQWATPVLLSGTEDLHSEDSYSQDDRHLSSDCLELPDQCFLQHEFQEDREYHWFDQTSALFIAPSPYYNYKEDPYISIAAHCGYREDSEQQFSMRTPQSRYRHDVATRYNSHYACLQQIA